MVALFFELGVPIEHSKLEGVSQILTFLDIEVDTASFQLQLLREKILRLQEKLASSIQKWSLTKKELQNLVGLLQFASKVIHPGRPFLRRLYSMQQIGSFPSHHIQLNPPVRADILWWYFFLDKWNGISILWDLHCQSPDVSVHSDTSGSWGCGAYGDSNWLCLKWCLGLQPLPIAIKELIPVILVAVMWGKQWTGKIVLFKVDNMAVVEVINATLCKDLHLVHLIWLLVFCSLPQFLVKTSTELLMNSFKYVESDTVSSSLIKIPPSNTSWSQWL